MEITKAMIEAYAKRFSIDLTDGSQEAGIVGSLQMLGNGQGELDAQLFNGNEILYPVTEAYYAAKGVEVPESVKVPLTPVDGDEPTDVMKDAPEAPAGEEAKPEAETPAENLATAEGKPADEKLPEDAPATE